MLIRVESELKDVKIGQTWWWVYGKDSRNETTLQIYDHFLCTDIFCHSNSKTVF